MPLAHSVFKSSFLLIGVKIVQRLLGLISLVLLARILTPNDFAIVALTSIIIYFFDILSNTGSEQYIIQKHEVNNDDLNTAWTIDLILKSALAILLIVCSGFLANFFEQPKLQSVLSISSFILIINALKNPGLYLLKQKLHYQSIFQLSVFQKFTSFFTVIFIAYIFQSYWALIVGDIIASLIFTLGSYRIHTFRPKISLKMKRMQWSFSKWLLVKSIIGYIRAQIDTLFVSKLFPAFLIGQYYMARNISLLPCHNIFSPALEPLLASFKKDKEHPARLSHQLDTSLQLISLITIPIALFVAIFPEQLISVLLGEQWQSSATVLCYFSLLILYFPYVLAFEQLLIAKNWLKASFLFDILSLSAIILAFLLGNIETIENIALLRGLTGCVTAFCLAIILHRYFSYSLFQLIAIIIICGISASIAAFAGYQTIIELNAHLIISFVILTMIYISCYIFSLYLILSLFANFNKFSSEILKKINTYLFNYITIKHEK